jgi:prepilin peptidase CpaA
MFLLTAGLSDAYRYRIPNLVVLALVAAFFMAVLFGEPNSGIAMHVLCAGAAFLVGLVLFAFGVFGAGDGKLLAAVALFPGVAALPGVMLAIALFGLAFAGGLVIGRLLTSRVQLYFPQTISWPVPRMLQDGQGVPYGVAIAAGAVWMSPTFPSWVWWF